MADETAIGSAGAPDGGGSDGGSGGVGSPFQARAAFVQNWNWQSVVGINRGACERAGALHGINSETGGACETEWEAGRARVFTLGEAIDFLKSFASSMFSVSQSDCPTGIAPEGQWRVAGGKRVRERRPRFGCKGRCAPEGRENQLCF